MAVFDGRRAGELFGRRCVVLSDEDPEEPSGWRPNSARGSVNTLSAERQRAPRQDKRFAAYAAFGNPNIWFLTLYILD